MLTKFLCVVIAIFLCVAFWFSENLLNSITERKFARNLGSFPNFKRVIISTKARSGSSWTGSLMSQNSGVYYTFEPLSYNDLAEVVENIRTPQQENKFFRDIVTCEFMNHTTYFKALIQSGMRFDNKLIIEYCNEDIVPSLCSVSQAENLQILCRTSKLHLIKTFLNLEVIFNGFNNLNIGIIHLLRDPRGTFLSRNELTNYTLLESLCEKIRHELTLDPRFYDPKRYYRVRYEDLALNPFEETKKLYKFVGLKYTVLTEHLIHSTSFDDSFDGDPFALKRKSSVRPFRWRKLTSFTQVQRIQEHCQDVLTILNYRIFKTEDEFRNLSISVLL